MSEEILEGQESEEQEITEESSDNFELAHTDQEWSEILDQALEEEVDITDDEEFGEWLDENYDLEYIEEEGDPEEEEDDEDEEGDIEEKRMSAAAKAKAKKYRASAAGKKAIAKYIKKASKAGYKVDKKRAKSMKKAALRQSYEVPTTKNQMLKNIYDEVNGMLKSDLAAKYESIMGATSFEDIEEDMQEEVRTQAAVTPQDIAPINVDDDIEALTKDEQGLTPDFKKKAKTIFEAAVHAKVVDEVNERMEEQNKEVEASKDEFQKELAEKVDGYLTYVVEEWMKENELAIERGIRSELVEDFMSGLKTLFTEHYIDIPEEKVDMVDDLFTKVEDLETSLDEEINRGVELQKELAQFKKDDAVKQTTKDLADSDSEKIAKLAEGIEFENTEQYIEKLSVLKESYFPKSKSVTSTITETDDTIEVQDLDESMQHYTSAIRRYNS